MPFDAQPVLQDDVLLDWYRSERNVAWQKEHRRVLKADREGRTERQLASLGIRHLRGALLQCRSDTRAFFDVHATVWFAAMLPLRELAKAVAIDCWGHRDCGTVRDVADSVFDLSGPKAVPCQLEHRLIVVSKSDSPEAALILLDGYRRSAALIRANSPEPIAVHWGVCANLDEWDYYRMR